MNPKRPRSKLKFLAWALGSWKGKGSMGNQTPKACQRMRNSPERERERERKAG